MIELNGRTYDIEVKAIQKMLKSDLDELVHDLNEEVDYDVLDEAVEAIEVGDEQALVDTDLWEMDVNPVIIEKNEIVENVLVEAGYKVTRSNHGVSLYAINDNNEEVRISDHKRPPIMQGNVPVQEHEEGFIVEGINVNSNDLIALGFSKLETGKKLYLA
ncbi:hypothetical protein [Terrihalobacillus insolitus]|uniref:hypothetical protein n=1 Tax=Terrihalobacillus insolitus TaxID=2950438 RepID=UPI0023401D83|nr:hypothetical protein [Terrihalobacillus insolitus]MDC3414256.1 hypothetical protein [Terrihalobacillus insolitus]